MLFRVAYGILLIVTNCNLLRLGDWGIKQMKQRLGKRRRNGLSILNAALWVLVAVLLAVLGVLMFMLFGGPGTPAKKDPLKVPYINTDGKLVVCLDAGHGFKDPGTYTKHLIGYEKDVTMSIVGYLKEELEARGATVLLTHDGKTFPKAWEIEGLAENYGIEVEEGWLVDNDVFSAAERGVYLAALEKKEPIDLFVSIHINSIKGHPEVSRYEFYYYEGNVYTGKLEEFCESLEASLDNEAIWKAKPYEDAYFVTKRSECPAILIESGYATNKEWCQNLNSEVWRKEYARVLAEVIVGEFS